MLARALRVEAALVDDGPHEDAHDGRQLVGRVGRVEPVGVRPGDGQTALVHRGEREEAREGTHGGTWTKRTGVGRSGLLSRALASEAYRLNSHR